ncbi:MAG: GLPGLI family protein [Flavobacteriaceae bacterium]|nr:GLPGLI family protein [Flavobacteriaceae bacterium]MCY4217187.1 GLPGLI family protein [Flavobacteriaceae bacterium]MCY4254357.1 GLPGLI family protein [Flavobacteriaceae bacterium]
MAYSLSLNHARSAIKVVLRNLPLFLLGGYFIYAQPSSIQLEYHVTGFGKNNLKGILHYHNEEAIFYIVDSRNSHQEKQVIITDMPLNEGEAFSGMEFILESLNQIPSSDSKFPPFYSQMILNEGVRFSSVDFEFLDQELVLKEDMGIIEWNLQSESKQINGFNCQKANGKFGGRDYTVWYTNEIPINIGPWKLDGLPGAIVEGSDSKEVSFLLSKVLFDLDWPNIEKLSPDPENTIYCEEYFRLLEQNSIERDKQFKARLSRGFAARLDITTNLVQKECD